MEFGDSVRFSFYFLRHELQGGVEHRKFSHYIWYNLGV